LFVVVAGNPNRFSACEDFSDIVLKDKGIAAKKAWWRGILEVGAESSIRAKLCC
jgi:hypothetical protein